MHLGLCAVISAQISTTLPVSHLYAFELTQLPNNQWSTQYPRWLTQFNPNGYNNQPVFASDDVIFFSIRFEGEVQNDIYALDLKDLKRYRVTKTRESEYSPFVDVKNASIYTVQVDAGPAQQQRLWQYPLELDNFGHEVAKLNFQVGYFTRVFPDQFAVYSVEEPSKLYLLNPENGTLRLITERVGRCLKPDDDGNLMFIQEVTDELQYLKVFDDEYQTAQILTRLPKHIKDFTSWEGLIWYGDKAKLHHFDPEKGIHKQVADLSEYGITNITRLTIHNNTLVLVNTDEQ
jgi:hypothetical protein